MIRGYFLPTGSEASPPYVDGLIDIPEIGVVGLEARFLIDTGAGSLTYLATTTQAACSGIMRLIWEDWKTVFRLRE